jgi:hypothetical protein
MGNSFCKNLRQLCHNFKINSTCVSSCCSTNAKQEVILSPIANKEVPIQHAHHIEHHEHIENIGGGIILHTIEDKIVCD